MRDDDDALRLRRDDEEDRNDFGRSAEAGPAGAPSILAITTTVTTYPLVPNLFYGVIAQSIFGPEVEGGAGTLTAGALFYAYNTGSTIPPVGTKVLCTYVTTRWVFQYDG